MGNKRLLAVIGLLLSSVFASYGAFADARANADDVFVMVDTLHDSYMVGDVNEFERFVFARLKDQFPHARFVSVRESDSARIRQELQKIVDDGAVIVGLLVNSHGDSAISAGKYMSFLDFGREIINVADPEETQRVFGPLVGHYAPDARIILAGCATVEKGTAKDKIPAMMRVARNFGLESGSLYMNETPGNNFRDVIFKQPFQVQKKTEDLKRHLILQLTAPVSYPLMLFYEKVYANQGFTLFIERKEGNPLPLYRMYEDDFFNAESSAEPSGDLVFGYR